MANKTIVNWEAREFIEYKKNAGWYAGMIAVVAVLCAIAVLIQLWTFLILVIVAAIALLTYTIRPPRMLHYSLSDKGLSEGNNLYAFEDFKSFGVLNENNHYCIMMVPRNRFGTRVRVYFPEAEGEQIVDVFGAHLPMEPVKLDLLDRLVRFLRI